MAEFGGRERDNGAMENSDSPAQDVLSVKGNFAAPGNQATCP